MIDEQIDVVGKFMSDPITTAEYYSMAGIFKSTKSMERILRPTRWFEHVLSSKGEQKHAENEVR